MKTVKYQINYKSEPNDKHISIPIGQHLIPVDKNEFIEKDFVDEEVDKAINPPVDNEKARFMPFNITSGSLATFIKFKLNFMNKNTNVWGDTWGSPALDQTMFTDEDLKLNLNNYRKSFLRINFYDSSDIATRNLVLFAAIFTQLDDDQRTFDPITGKSIVNKAVDALSTFTVYDNFIYPNKEGIEGFNIFWFRADDFILTPITGRELYAEFTFSSAKTGKVYDLISKDIQTTPLTTSQILTERPVKFKLYYEDKSINIDYLTNYYYEIDDLNREIFIMPDGSIQIDLYQI